MRNLRVLTKDELAEAHRLCIADIEGRLAACEQENVALRELLREVDETILRMAGKLTTKIREALK